MHCRWSVLAVALMAACSDPASEPPFESPGPGLIFGFPFDGQLDVSVDANIVVAFSEAVDTGVLREDSCSLTDGLVVGGLCLVNQLGPVAGQWQVVGPLGRALEFSPSTHLDPATRYDLHIDPTLLESRVGNVDANSPSLSFTTNQLRSQRGEPPVVVAINGEAPERFALGSQPRLPFVDFSTIRLVFSEPVDESSVALGTGICLVALGSPEESISGSVLAQGVHVSVDPDEDLDPSKEYELRITTALRDATGEAALTQSFPLSPAASRGNGDLYRKTLDVQPGIGDESFPEASGISSLSQNHVLLRSDLIGENSIQLQDGRIEMEMSHPELFGPILPVVIRKGQSLLAGGLAVSLGGVVSSGLNTGDLRLSFVTDVTGFLLRNQFWPASTIPDNAEAPLQVILNLDIALSALDKTGNAVLTQNLLGVQATGLVEVIDGQLYISNVGFLDLDLLGIAQAPAAMALALRSSEELVLPGDSEAPTLVASYPGDQSELVEMHESIVLSFSEAMWLRGSTTAELRTDFDTAVPAFIRAMGSSVIISPQQPLDPDTGYRISLGAGLTDLSGNNWAPAPGDPSGGTGVIDFVTRPLANADHPPVIVTAYPGAPCALQAGSRRCVGGGSQDEDYLDFLLPANHPVEVVFDQPMRSSSLVLGQACGQGSVRIEVMDANSCTASVPGTLSTSERSLRFVPDRDWTPGQEYRLVLRAGSNSSCGVDELCGLNGLALNTDPLGSARDSGGPNAEFRFTGADPSLSSVAVTNTRPLVDRNGNARVDPGESTTETNRAAVRLTDVTGLVSSASLAMEDCDPGTPETDGCMYLSADLIVRLEESVDGCSIDSAAGLVQADHCIPVEVSPGAIYGTELVLNANILGLGIINNLSTGKIVLRTRQDGQPIRGYIVEDGSGMPELLVTLKTFMDAPDLSILGGLANHDLSSKELDVSLRGPVEFRSDGRLRITLRNEELIPLTVGVTALGFNSGSMSMQIAAGGMVVEFASRSAQGGLR